MGSAAEANLGKIQLVFKKHVTIIGGINRYVIKFIEDEQKLSDVLGIILRNVQNKISRFDLEYISHFNGSMAIYIHLITIDLINIPKDGLVKSANSIFKRSQKTSEEIILLIKKLKEIQSRPELSDELGHGDGLRRINQAIILATNLNKISLGIQNLIKKQI